MVSGLAKPIADYIDAQARLDLDGMMKPFLPGAIFTDNGKQFVGHTGIREMLQKMVIDLKAIFEPDTIREEDGDVVLEGPISGEFPNSPIRFTQRFTLEDDAIKVLESMEWA